MAHHTLQHRGHNNHLIHIMQPERIYSRTHIFQQKQWKEFITNTNNLLMYWSKFQAQITTSNRKEKTQQSHTHTFKIKASIQKSRASSMRSTHILHMKIFADFPRKLHAQELGHKLGFMHFTGKTRIFVFQPAKANYLHVTE